MRGSKLLDGMDAAVLASAWRKAESCPERPVFLISGDWGVGAVTRQLQRSSAQLGHERFPANLQFKDLIPRRRGPSPHGESR